jgi:putative tricarboxylic transport membrane protein
MVDIAGPFVEALGIVFSSPVILYLILGVFAGMIIGAIPGLGPALGMSVALPLTLPLDGNSALLLLAGIYLGACYGGSVSAILINVPGTSAAAATTLDGYPLTKQGNALHALSLSASSSVVGGLISFATLILISPILIEVVRLFGSPEYFLLAALGLAMITIVTQGSTVKGLTAGAFGFALTTIGISPTTPEYRFTFGLIELSDGVSYVAVLLGLFAVGEMMQLSTESGSIASADPDVTGSVVPGIRSVLSKPKLVLKSSIIGMIIGAIPGSGAAVSNFVAWIEAKRSSATPDLFGTGFDDGIIASETSNNATVGGSIVPTIAFGIPGSGATAVLLGGFVMHGLVPGPEMFDSGLHVTYSLFVGMWVGSIVILILAYSLITRAHYVTKIDSNVIIPIVISIAVIGSVALRNNIIDVFTVALMGLLGYYMKQHDYSIIAFLLGVILGPIAEENLNRSLAISGGSYDIFVADPISQVLTLLIALVILGPLLRPYLVAARRRLGR